MDILYCHRWFIEKLSIPLYRGSGKQPPFFDRCHVAWSFVLEDVLSQHSSRARRHNCKAWRPKAWGSDASHGDFWKWVEIPRDPQNMPKLWLWILKLTNLDLGYHFRTPPYGLHLNLWSFKSFGCQEEREWPWQLDVTICYCNLGFKMR